MCSAAAESDTPPPASPSFWRDVRVALQGNRCDYTREPVKRALLLLGLPMVLETLMQSVFAIVNVFWVSHFGRDAIVVVGLTESVMTLIYAVAVGLAIAAAAIVSRRIGQNDSERAAQSAAQVVVLGTIVSTMLGALFGYYAEDILQLMGASRSTVDIGTHYARIVFVGNGTVFLIFIINAIFRGGGDAVLAMRTLALANGLNILLAPCFIFGWGPLPEMGVTGAAVATVIARGTGLLYQLKHLTGRHSRVRVTWRHFKPELPVLTLILRTSANGVIQLLIGTTSLVALYRILAAFGTAAVAGYAIAIRVVVLVMLPAWGLAGAAAILVGQNLGALQPDRAEAAVRIAARFNIKLIAATSAFAVIFAPHLVQLLTQDPAVLSNAVPALRIVSIGVPIYAVAMCFGAAFNGAGDTWTPTRTSFFCLWLGQIPMAWLLSDTFGLGPLGAFIAVPISLSLLALCNYVLFRRGRWKLQNV
jgi:putative MATE family efflux protein